MLSVLQHALGCDQYGRGTRYRSHFVAGPGHSDYDTCVEAVENGLMTRHRSAMLGGNGDLFCVTMAGQRYVTEESASPPRLTRSQQRYRRYCDADTGLSFREWFDFERACARAEW